MHRPLRILALGDSYTIGEGVAAEQRWISRYAAQLRERGFAVDKPTVVARTGWTTDELDAAINKADPQGSWDLVTLLIGVNDQYRGRDAVEYRERFRGLLSRALGYAGGETGRVLVLSIPDWGVTPFARQNGRDPALVEREIDRYNAIAQQETESRGVTFVDVTAISRLAANDSTLLAADQLHPSATMYAMWVEAVERQFALPAQQD